MHDVQHLQSILILLAAAVLIVAVCKMLRLSPVIGYLIAGVAIGPHGFAIIQDVKTTSAIAEFGVVFLLFMIGLELSLARLKAMRRLVFGLGGAQVVVTSIVLGAIAWGLGATTPAAIIIGGALALSSTAIVLKVIEESGQKATQVGRMSFAVLLLQDLAVVPLLVLTPLLGAEGGNIALSLGEAGVKAAIALAVIFVVGRQLIRPLFHFIASFHNAELFLATALLVVLGISWATYIAGLSLALGAFVAGLLVAETEFQHQVEADIKPAKGLLLGLFFMAVGMSVDVAVLHAHVGQIVALALGLMAIKTALIVALFRLFRLPLSTGIHSGLLLSQGGEFAFILFGMAALSGVLSGALSQMLLVVVTLTMALTPLAAGFGKYLAARLEARQQPGLPADLSAHADDLANHVVIAGFGRMGQTVAKLLMEEGIPFVALDTNIANVAYGQQRGKPVYYGDASRADMLAQAGLGRASAVMVTLKASQGADRAIQTARSVNPDLPIIARARDIAQVKHLEAIGATLAIAEVFESSLQAGGELLRHLGTPTHEISRIINMFRDHDYERAVADLRPSSGSGTTTS